MKKERKEKKASRFHLIQWESLSRYRLFELTRSSMPLPEVVDLCREIGAFLVIRKLQFGFCLGNNSRYVMVLSAALPFWSLIWT